MAPFGKNFLKARLKNKSKQKVETTAKEIQVLVGKEEKVVSGVTKHTTCSDIVHALLEDHKTIPESKRLLHGESKEFCLLERWKGFERPLPPLTRILRLWNAWGDERPFIQFVLVKTTDFIPKRSSKFKGLRSKRWEHGAGQYARNLPVDQQKRMVKKAFRKLEKMQKSRSSDGLEEIDKMVQLIISQDCIIRQQLHQIKELDMELELVDQQMKECFVPNTGLNDISNVQLLSLFQWEDQLQEYLYTSDVIAQLDQQVLGHNELINVLCRDIDLELRKVDCKLDSEELKGATAACPALDFDQFFALSSEESLELATLQSELDASMRSGIALHTQTLDLEKEMQQNAALLQSRNQEYQYLIAQMDSMQMDDCAEPKNPIYLKNPDRLLVSQNTTEINRPKCLPGDVTDTDSDTGISSTHSQDSLSPCVDSLPTLDTDV